MDYTKLTIKHFITDLPRIFNENFEGIKQLFNKFVKEDNNTINIKADDGSIINGEFDRIVVNRIDAKNIYIKDQDNNLVPLKNYITDKVIECINDEPKLINVMSKGTNIVDTIDDVVEPNATSHNEE